MSTAVITGASSGIGKEIAAILSDMGYDLVLAARRTDILKEFASTLKTSVEIIGLDLSKEENCYSLYDRCSGRDVEILVNNAGFGDFGIFSDTSLERDLEMLGLNVRCVHILTKLFLKDFQSKNKGRILNVASAAGFMPAGPLLDTYYATKAYVLNLTRGISYELKKAKSGVTVSALCPGPVKTQFSEVAGVDFASVGMTADVVAKAAVDGMMKGKTVIVPGTLIKIGRFLTRLLPDSVLCAFAYTFQRSKTK